MMIHPQFDPIAISIGPLAVRWYGLMYLVAFTLFFLLGRWRLSQPDYAARSGLNPQRFEDCLFWGALGVIVGGRLGYVFFYKPTYFLAHPEQIFAVWQGGMAYHGGLLGVIGAIAVYARRQSLAFWPVIDFIAPLVPWGLAAGRLGNFINGELWGRPSDLPWAMIFPQAGDSLPRHPSQLYQFAGEGLLLGLVLWWYSAKPRQPAQVSGMFLLGYGVARFIAEWFREPDAFLPSLALELTMGQWLSLPMIVLGIVLIFFKKD
ncbi:MAG: prolipoprotein diacylglyceryl transferase [Betaproteobacteria bacterium]|nr:prolipoprotein diacylglyceryl transferase [Pseudomonadota bacterium]NBO03254.1 prolipoprotein diacylglyceryl transferase [Betaproteobacteria bacterium]HAB47020.1 prolipoprotein diacylglyceryl transferase [Lautropia sp.]NBO95167.1 prolipoprotein diacylglyceryl transferase [Betaproteobacteria bacterium]NBP34052.1 prolipoprotein diacylglyceryl transferase [Betaproteobacteria bacterium]